MGWLEAGHGTLSAPGKPTPLAETGHIRQRQQAGFAEGRQKRHCFVTGETVRNNDSPVVTYPPDVPVSIVGLDSTPNLAPRDSFEICLNMFTQYPRN